MKNLAALRPLSWLFALALLLVAACPLAEASVPAGSYQQTCRGIAMHGTTLTAQCTNFFGNPQGTSLADAEKCVADKHDIANINGDLRCVLSSLRIGGSNPYTGDIISITSDEKTATQETKVFRIDHPRVDIAADEYRSISFKPGDTVTITAGGCVQTGGSGATWKSYVYPTGDSAQTYYSGTAFVPDVIPSGRLSGIVNKSWPVPVPKDPALKKEYFLTLGYQDNEYDDNGYWGHDNGNNNQCLNVGPAWVEVKVVSKLRSDAKKEVVWSPHSRPFDLVWDINNEDFNGLPLNPKWAHQVDHPGSLPDFAATCGPAISGGDTININKLAQVCTSQDPTADLDPSSWFGLGCQGVLDGHLNWYIATYTGTMFWEDWSGGWPNDGDYNFLMDTPDKAGFTKLNSSSAGELGLGLEFKGGETISDAQGAWWQQLHNGAENGGQPTPSAMLSDGFGLKGVVIGLIGIDGVHGGYTESHPVFALALRTTVTQLKDGVQENWVFFLRNFGGEGGCGQDIHTWASSLDNEYFLQLPWPEGATDVKVVGENHWWAWQEGNTKGWILRSPDPGWTLVKFQFPSDGQFGVDGQFTLQYSLPGPRPAPKKRAVAPSKKAAEFKITDVSSHITNPAARAKFMADVNALKPLSIPPPRKRVAMTVDTAIKVQPPIKGAASRGEGTRAKSSPDPAKKQLDEAVKKLEETYRPQMQALPPAKK